MTIKQFQATDSPIERFSKPAETASVGVGAASEERIETIGLSKHYGVRPVIQDLNLKVKSGEVYALVGPNGAGKTTVIRLITGLAFPSGGQVKLLGVDPIRQPQIKRQIGAVVEAPAAFYPYMTGRNNLRLHASLVGKVSEKRISEVLDMLELGNASDRKVGVYSLGMRQRLGVAAAILTKPEVLILDEPASGMDPLSLHLVHKVLQQAAQEGAAVFISTHHLDEVTAYCNRVGILEEGVLIDEVDLGTRRSRYRIHVDDVPKAMATLNRQNFINFVQPRGSERREIIFELKDMNDLGYVASLLSQEGVKTLELAPDYFDLRAYYKERVADPRARAKKDQ